MKEPLDINNKLTDKELLEMCCKQDNDALRQLFVRHERAVYSLLKRLLTSSEDAEEALADVFVKIWKSSKTFKSESKFTTWLYTIASNTAKDKLRAKKNKLEVTSIETIPGEWDFLVGKDDISRNPADLIVKQEDKNILLKSLEKLSFEDRQLISLFHFNELSYEEIGVVTGISIVNLKVRLFRARQRLRSILGNQEKEISNDELQRSATKFI